MATYQQYSQPYEHALFHNLHSLTHGQYGFPTSKTPTDSLANHTGYSPGPLLTTPPISRNPSQPPEPSQDHVPDHLPWDNASFSDSPTVMTPDAESIEVDALAGSQIFYHHNGQNMPIPASYTAVSAMDTGMLVAGQGLISDQDVNAAFQDTLVSQSQPWQQPYEMQTQSQQQLFEPPYQQYATQPLPQDPWNGQWPLRSSVVPLSGQAMFDPATDQLGFSQHIASLDNGRVNHPDPSYLISPSEPTLPPQDDFQLVTASQHPLHHDKDQVPCMQLVEQLPIDPLPTNMSSPPDNLGFVNYQASHPCFSDYHTNCMSFPSSVHASSQAISIDEPIITPPAASPISSEGMLSSYTHSEPGVLVDQYLSQHYFPEEPQPSQIMDVEYTPPASIPETVNDISPRRKPTQNTTGTTMTKSAGGRTLGTHLEPQVAKAAHDMRKIVACWHCVLQRDKCGPGDICERCLKRSQRPNADCGLGCSRIKLVDLSVYFLPDLVTQMHEDSNLTRFVTQYIHQWGNVELEVYMTCGQEGMPRIPVKVYEFFPRGNALLVQYQYNTDPVTHQTVAVEKQSPALGMVHINYNEEKKYDKYITDIVDYHLDAFGELCWKEDDDDFLKRLFKLMTRVKPKNDDEGKLLREVFRLVVVTYIMAHTLTIAEETKVATLSRMRSYGGYASYAENFTSPRMTNRQLKYFFSRLQRSIQNTVLNKLQQIFKSSKGCDKWLAAFVALLGMCMALEDQQQTIHLVMETKARTEGVDIRDAQAQADFANREIDERIQFIQQLFRWKYNRKCNPLANADCAWEQETGFGDASSVTFVRQVAQLVRDKIDYLQQRQKVSISHTNQTKYAARLVSQFLLSFWLPSG